ncbi:hypothetical protein [Lactococcus phage 712]|uniref:Uncharacterized protein n=1 Tax=Lactococcus phage 712 TaxID=2892346 RepID=Q09WR8_9CAUD|nr:hypothetical protein LPV712_gp036 [Lactococcus phage 712]ABB77603.1 hypothetical protein [Lactococcus phage 712]
METINIKFDKEQLDDIMKKVIENIMKEDKPNFYELSDTGREEPKKERSVMYLEANETNDESKKKKVYFGFRFKTLTKEFATYFDSSDRIDLKRIEELKRQGWKEEVFYK